MEKDGERPIKSFIEYGGRRFHARADSDAYHMALSMMARLPRGPVLDLAAGAGYTSLRLADLGFQVKALDIHAGQFVPTEIPFQQANLNEGIPEDTASQSGALALEVIEHLENPRHFLKEIGRVVRPGGGLVLSTPNIVSVKSKLLFLFREELQLFFDEERRVRDPFCHEASGHISPILPWLLRIFLLDGGFVIAQTEYTRKWGMRSKHLGRSLLVRALRKGGI